MNKHNLKSYISLFFAVFIWSSAFVVSKFSLSEFGPLALSSVRIFIAFLVLLPFALKRGFRINHLFSKTAFMYGIFGYGGNLALLSIGLLYCSASISAIIHGLFPVFMIFLGYIMLDEKISKNKFIGVVLSILGVAIASIGDISQNKTTTVLGIILVTLSVLTWAYYSVLSKKKSSNLDTFILSEICFGNAFISLLPFTIIEILLYSPSMPAISSWIYPLYLGAFSGGIGILLWNYGLKKADSSIAGIYFNLMPVIGLFFGLLVGEKISFLQVAGSALILVGVFVCSATKDRPRD